MGSEIVVMSISDIEKMANAVAKSNLFGVKTPEQAMALMCIAQAEGLHPAIAARDYHIIEGKPSLKADAMLARFQNAGGSVKWHSYTDDKVSASFAHPQGGEVEVTWDMPRAKQAGLANKNVWKQYPRQMLRARTISEGIKTVYPGATGNFYTPEEMMDFDAKPPMKDVTPEFKAEVDTIMAEAAPKRGRPKKEEKPAELVDVPGSIPIAPPAQLFDTDGKRTGYVGRQIQTIEVATLDELKALRESEQKFWSLMKESPNPLDAQGANDIISFYNETLRRLKTTVKPFDSAKGDSLDDF